MRGLLLAIACAFVMAPASAKTITCKGFAFGYAQLSCEIPDDPPVKAAPFCDVMNRQGGYFAWSRNDTSATKDRADLINAVGKRLCGWGKK